MQYFTPFAFRSSRTLRISDSVFMGKVSGVDKGLWKSGPIFVMQRRLFRLSAHKDSSQRLTHPFEEHTPLFRGRTARKSRHAIEACLRDWVRENPACRAVRIVRGPVLANQFGREMQ